MNSLKFLNLYSKAGLEEILLRDMSWGLIYILKRVKKGNSSYSVKQLMVDARRKKKMIK